jgi:hypothetical protein
MARTTTCRLGVPRPSLLTQVAELQFPNLRELPIDGPAIGRAALEITRIRGFFSDNVPPGEVELGSG